MASKEKDIVEENKEDDFDWDKIIEQGFLKNKDARRVGNIYGNEFAMYFTEDQQFSFEDKNTPKLLKAGIIEGIREEFNSVNWKEYCEPVKVPTEEEIAKMNSYKAPNTFDVLLRNYLVFQMLFSKYFK